MGTETVLRLNQVTLGVRDVSRSVAFYRSLGLVSVVDGDLYARLVAPGNGVTLSLDRVEEPRPSSTVVYFECDDLDAKVASLRTTGHEFDSGPQDQRWLWREARLRDPDGHPLCLYHAGEMRLNPPWRVGPTPDTDAERREAEVRRTVETLIAQGSAYHVEALEQIYHRDLRIVKVDETGRVEAIGREENLEFFRQRRARGAAPLSTAAEFVHVEASGIEGQVIVIRRMQMGERPERSTFSLHLVHEDGRWQVVRETAFVQALEADHERS